MEHKNWLIGFGGLIALVGFAALVANLRFLLRSKPARGNFARWVVKKGGSVGAPTSTVGANTYYPVVSYRDDEGREHEVTGRTGLQSRTAPGDRQGKAYPVRYDPSKPEDARIMTFAQFWLLPFGFIAAGLFAMAVVAKAT